MGALSSAPGLASTTYQAAALAWRIEPAVTVFLYWARFAKSFARLPGVVTKSASIFCFPGRALPRALRGFQEELPRVPATRKWLLLGPYCALPRCRMGISM